MNAPVITITSGVANWTAPSTAPASWFLCPVFQDGSITHETVNYLIELDGSITSQDVSFLGTGQYLKFFGVDASNGIFLTPTISSNST